MNKTWLLIFLILTTGATAFLLISLPFSFFSLKQEKQTPKYVHHNDIREAHQLLNQYVCYQSESEWTKDSSLWKKNERKLQTISKTFLVHSSHETDEALQTDLQRISRLAEEALITKNIALLVQVHRMSHDLDILMNGYEETLWHVTKLEQKEEA
jgi:hypothetical protein